MIKDNQETVSSDPRKKPGLELVSSNSSYPYELRFCADNPNSVFGQTVLGRLKSKVHQACRFASITDYKVVDTATGFHLLFRSEIDEMHFHYTQEVPLTGELMAGVYKTMAIGNQEKRMQQKLLRRFAKAARKAGLRDKMWIEPSDDGQSVILYADNLTNYFKIWSELPAKRKESLIKGFCSELMAEDTLEPNEHNSLRIA